MFHTKGKEIKYEDIDKDIRIWYENLKKGIKMSKDMSHARSFVQEEEFANSVKKDFELTSNIAGHIYTATLIKYNSLRAEVIEIQKENAQMLENKDGRIKTLKLWKTTVVMSPYKEQLRNYFERLSAVATLKDNPVEEQLMIEALYHDIRLFYLTIKREHTSEELLELLSMKLSFNSAIKYSYAVLNGSDSVIGLDHCSNFKSFLSEVRNVMFNHEQAARVRSKRNGQPIDTGPVPNLFGVPHKPVAKEAAHHSQYPVGGNIHLDDFTGRKGMAQGKAPKVDLLSDPKAMEKMAKALKGKPGDDQGTDNGKL